MDKAILIVVLLASHAGAQSRDWAAVQRADGQSVVVSLRDGKVVRGKLEKWTPAALDLSSAKGVEQIARPDVSAVRVERHGSRKKGALWGAVIGFGIAFPIGAAAAGNLTDRNNPSAATRAGMGAGFGLLAAGIGAGLGTLAGGSHTETIYRAP
jgi:hypothetical protein